MFDDTQIENQVEETIQEQPEQVEEIKSDQLVAEEKSDFAKASTDRQESAQAKNFRQLREKAERAERERDEAIRILREIEVRSAQEVPEEDYSINLDPDALAEGKHLNKVDKKIKKLEEQLRQYQYQSATYAVEAKLKSDYPDFDKIVSPENVESLKNAYPEIADTIMASSSDLYKKGVSAYTMIKNLGIYKEDNYVQDRERAQRNAAKPKPLTSINAQQGDSPLSRANAFANGLTDELKTQLRKEMELARKNI
ncbi:MAG TPA: hypothetical protein VFF04_04610 [Candidatus Babeliales bacterium]|nr:hypothetical protein [Candidatus Babeliales bacterium]